MEIDGPTIVITAVALHPLTGAVLTLPQIHEMTERMFEAEVQWLPRFAARSGVSAGPAR